MATSSFSNNIIIKNRRDAERFLIALEKAENKKSKEVKIDGVIEDIKDKEQIKSLQML